MDVSISLKSYFLLLWLHLTHVPFIKLEIILMNQSLFLISNLRLLSHNWLLIWFRTGRFWIISKIISFKLECIKLKVYLMKLSYWFATVHQVSNFLMVWLKCFTIRPNQILNSLHLLIDSVRDLSNGTSSTHVLWSGKCVISI